MNIRVKIRHYKFRARNYYPVFLRHEGVPVIVNQLAKGGLRVHLERKV